MPHKKINCTLIRSPYLKWVGLSQQKYYHFEGAGRDGGVTLCQVIYERPFGV